MTPDPRAADQLQLDMETARISFERWRSINRRARPSEGLRTEYTRNDDGLSYDDDTASDG